MANLGSAKTTRFSIGTAEVRIGRLQDANKLTQAHSIGVLDNVTVEVAQESTNLEAGFPKQILDSAVISQNASMTATPREYSRRNLQIMLGEGVASVQPTDVATAITTSISSGSTSVAVTDASSMTAGDLVVIYCQERPEEVSICRILSISTNTLTLDAGTPTLMAHDGTADTIKVYVANQVAIGNIAETNYMSVQILQLARGSSRPIGFNFWKASVSQGMSLGMGGDDFASTDLGIQFLQPAAAEYGVGQPLVHLNNVIPSNSTGFYFAGGDA